MTQRPTSLTEPSTSAGPTTLTPLPGVDGVVYDGDISFDDSEISDDEAIDCLSSVTSDNQRTLEACSVR